MDIPFLTIMLVVPLIGTLITLLMGRWQKASKYVASAFSLATAGLATYILYMFLTDPGNAMFSESHIWIQAAGITLNYSLAVDGLSLVMVILTAGLVPIVMLFASGEKDRPHVFFAMLLAMEVGLLGVYTSADFFLFYIFWEVTLIPMFFMISWWGGPRRHYAAIKFFIYTHVASLIMLIGIFALVFQAGSGNFAFDAINVAGLSTIMQAVLFGLLFFGFAVKMPIVPFHTWLPDAHVEAPTAGSVILAAVMLKMGSYGIIRVCVQMMPEAAVTWQIPMIVLGLIAAIYGAWACIAQKDLKKMVAYSSISHMGIVLVGIATLTEAGVMFAVFQMFAHGLISAVLFMVCGIAAHNVGTREIPLLGGLAGKMPLFAVFMMFSFMASLGLPGLAGFIAEFGITAAFYNWLTVQYGMGYLIIFALIPLMLTAGYYLWAMQRTIFGRETTKIDMAHVHDVNKTELIAMGVLCALIAVFGIMPSLLTDVILQMPLLMDIAASVVPFPGVI